MDILNRIKGYAAKHRYAIAVLLLGLCMMVIPFEKSAEEQTQEVTQTQPTQPDVQTQLQQILAKIQGVGEVEVLLTVQSGAYTAYQQTESASGTDTVIVTDSQRGEYGLVQQEFPPTYRGAIIVCQGGDRAAVRLAVTEAVEKVTGLSSDKIIVLKMK